MIKKRLQSFVYAFQGIQALFRDEPNARIHLGAAVLVNVAGLWFKISTFEWVALWVCIGLVFIAEIINTALENICDHISPEKNVRIGEIKDLAAAAVLISVVISVIVAALIFAGKI